MQESKLLQFYKIIKKISIEGSEPCFSGELTETFQEENDALLVPKKIEMTFDEVYKYGGSGWQCCGDSFLKKSDVSFFKRKRLLYIQLLNWVKPKIYTEKTLEKIIMETTYYMVTPSMRELMRWHNSDDIIRYVTERGLSFNSHVYK